MEFEYTPDDRNKSCKIANGSPSDFQRKENSAGLSQLSWTASVAAYLRKSSECWFRTVHLENVLGPVNWNHGVIFHVFFWIKHFRCWTNHNSWTKKTWIADSKAHRIGDVPTTTNWTHDHWQLSTYVLIKKVQASTFADCTILQQRAMFHM